MDSEKHRGRVFIRDKANGKQRGRVFILHYMSIMKTRPLFFLLHYMSIMKTRPLFFLEIFERFAESGTFGLLQDDLVEAFPDKRESILSVPVYADDGGE
jgi:hypothetical protein